MKEFKKPDLNAPRFRNKSMSILNSSLLKEFKKKYPEYKDLNILEFKKIIGTFNSNITKGIIENRNGVELPEGLGYIFMGTCSPAKKNNINYKKSEIQGFSTKHHNWDSDNKLLKIFYTNQNTKYPFKNKQVWAFKAVKIFRKAASEAYKKNWTKYIEVAPTEKIMNMFDRHRKKTNIQNLKPVIPENYDEFKL